MVGPQVRVGVGIYSRAEAAHLLRVTPSRLRRWVGGYTYRNKQGDTERGGRVPPVVRADLPIIHHSLALSFVELMELRVVKALVDRGLSLQHVRRASALAASTFETSHPFASRRVYTDGRRVLAGLAAGSESRDLVELSHRRVLQVIAGGVLEPFLDEVDFDESTALAERWWPLGRQTPIVLDPRVAFGAPTIAGTRLRTLTVAGVTARASPQAVARSYELSLTAIRAAVQFEATLAAA
jgi:uncharacterized protein (DUF433 family)